MSEKELSQSRAGTSRGDSVSSDKDSTRKLRSGKKRFQVESPEGQTSSQRFRTDQLGDITLGSPRSELTGSALSGSNLTDRQNSETQPLVMESREQEDPEDVDVYVENAATESSETVSDVTKVYAIEVK